MYFFPAEVAVSLFKISFFPLQLVRGAYNDPLITVLLRKM